MLIDQVDRIHGLFVDWRELFKKIGPCPEGNPDVVRAAPEHELDKVESVVQIVPPLHVDFIAIEIAGAQPLSYPTEEEQTTTAIEEIRRRTRAAKLK